MINHLICSNPEHHNVNDKIEYYNRNSFYPTIPIGLVECVLYQQPRLHHQPHLLQLQHPHLHLLYQKNVNPIANLLHIELIPIPLIKLTFKLLLSIFTFDNNLFILFILL